MYVVLLLDVFENCLFSVFFLCACVCCLCILLSCLAVILFVSVDWIFVCGLGVRPICDCGFMESVDVAGNHRTFIELCVCWFFAGYVEIGVLPV